MAITEDYVSSETAKLLIYKGFDIDECEVHYDPLDHTQYDITLQMAMKWLRKVHNIHIQAFRCPARVKRSAESSEYSKPWFYMYTFLTELEDIDSDFCSDEDFKTSEDAIDAAIKYCLDKFV